MDLFARLSEGFWEPFAEKNFRLVFLAIIDCIYFLSRYNIAVTS